MSAFTTVRPPIPESKTPIGLDCWLFGLMQKYMKTRGDSQAGHPALRDLIPENPREGGDARDVVIVVLDDAGEDPDLKVGSETPFDPFHLCNHFTATTRKFWWKGYSRARAMFSRRS